MALSTTGYFTTGTPPGTSAASGNYVPCAAPNATFNGATQYTNGTYFLGYNGTASWIVFGFGAVLYIGAGGSTTNMPLTGWVVNSGTAPAPTFADMAVAPGSISGISIISGISSISF